MEKISGIANVYKEQGPFDYVVFVYPNRIAAGASLEKQGRAELARLVGGQSQSVVILDPDDLPKKAARIKTKGR